MNNLRTQIAANHIPAHGQRQTRLFMPPFSQIQDLTQTERLVEQLTLVNQESGITLSALYCLDNLVKGDDLILKVRVEDPERQECAGQSSGDGDFQYEVVPFDKIIDAVQSGQCDAGLLIHEGQLFYESIGLHKILDLGEWWHERTGLPLPMGGNVIRRELGSEIIGQVSHWLRESIRYSLANREDALEYAMQFARDMDTELADRFVAMWVNDLTLDYTDRGREAVQRLLTEGFERGIIPHRPTVEFAI